MTEKSNIENLLEHEQISFLIQFMYFSVSGNKTFVYKNELVKCNKKCQVSVKPQISNKGRFDMCV